ncbi:MAG: HEAT repeat domain-containing protein [Planctomycetes bacterium]|nr:HEAT repeat domain-containing protein [Planctomycetota bacterium]
MRCVPVVVVFLLVGCGQAPPETAHGKAVSYWLDELKSSDARARKKAVQALGSAAGTVPEARAGLVTGLQDADADVRYEACLALVQLGKNTPAEALPLLEKAASDSDPRVKTAAAKALERVRGGS